MTLAADRPPLQRYRLPVGGDLAPETAAALLWRAGATGLWETADALLAWFPDRDRDVPAGGSWAIEPPQDWLELWRRGLDAVTVGRLTVAPPWVADLPAGAIVIDPAMAFGTGHHATTRMCLAALQDLPTDGARVLDVGTGSGVLAIAAVRLGAASVVAVDLDADAVDAARANAARCLVDVDVRLGSLEAVRGEAPFDVTVANLATTTLVELAADLVATVRPGGHLVVSGISEERADEVTAALTDAGAPTTTSLAAAEDGWALLVTRRRAGRGRHALAVSLLALCLAACTVADPAAGPPTPPVVDSTQPASAAPDPFLDALRTQTDTLAATFVAAEAALLDGSQAGDVAGVRDGAERAVHVLGAGPGLDGDLDGDGRSTASDAGPLFAPHEPDVPGVDVLSHAIEAAHDAGPRGAALVDVLRDPVAGDIGSWQRDATGQIAGIVAAAEAGDEAIAALDGHAPRALAWALRAASSDDETEVRRAVERATVHVALCSAAVAALTDR